jgi:hypothetical protein
VFTTSNAFNSGRLFRIKSSGGTPEPVAGVGEAVAFATMRRGRLVYAQTRSTPSEIWRMGGRQRGRADRTGLSPQQGDFAPP